MNNIQHKQSTGMIAGIIICLLMLILPIKLAYSEGIRAADFIGVWEYVRYGDKNYLKIVESNSEKFKLLIGNTNEGEVFWTDIWVKKSDGIYLKFSNGKLIGSFVSSNFYATHGKEFTYKITLKLISNNKIIYSIYSSINGTTDEFEAIKISD